jgi:hypothetical protein
MSAPTRPPTRLSARRRPPAARAGAAAHAPAATAAAATAAAAAAAAAARELTPFEQFVIDFLRARGAALVPQGPLEWDATLPSDLSRKWRRPSLRLVFDSQRTILPRGAVFAAPGSQAGLRLLREAREGGHLARFHAPERPGVDPRSIVGEGLVLHDVEQGEPRLGAPHWSILVCFHATLTFRGGSPEQDLRSVMVDPRGPIFDFWEPEDRRLAGLEPGFPDDVPEPDFDRGALWNEARQWLVRVLEPRAARWRRKVEENRDRDLARINAFYETRLDEERDRRRRRRSADDPDSEEPTTEAALKLEWGRRTKAVQARYAPEIEIRLWGIEEMARARRPVTYPLLHGGRKVGSIEVEVDLNSGSLVRPPCPVCGRSAGEFWWEGAGLVCRRCRGRGRAPKRAQAPAENPGSRGQKGT